LGLGAIIVGKSTPFNRTVSGKWPNSILQIVLTYSATDCFAGMTLYCYFVAACCVKRTFGSLFFREFSKADIGCTKRLHALMIWIINDE
jgi:hypothetical protein